MCSLCGNTGAEHIAIAMVPQLLTVFSTKIKVAVKGIRKRVKLPSKE